MRNVWVAVLGIVVAGCGSTKVSDEKRADLPPGAPDMIYVENFDLGATTLKSDPGTITGRPRLIHFGEKDPVKEIEKIGDDLENAIVAELHKANLPARRVKDGAARPDKGWLVGGELMEVVEGNRMQKAVVGFGAGNSHATLCVMVKDAAKPSGKDLLDFNVTSEGNKSPSGAVGAVATHTPYAMAGKFVLNRDAAEADIKRAARQISEELVKLVKAAPVASPDKP